VLAYQGWSFHVFRARVKPPAAPEQTNPDPPPMSPPTRESGAEVLIQTG
jgi:hypothetical protein